MKKYFKYLILSLLWACDTPLRFEKSQPEGVNIERGFNADYQGVYINENDETQTLSILPNLILLESKFNQKSHFNDLDTAEIKNLNATVDLKNREQVLKTIQENGYQAQVRGDTIILNFYKKDTLFSLGQDTELKYFQKNYFLNYKQDVPPDSNIGAWEVKVLSLTRKKYLTIADITEPQDLDNIVQITDYQELKDDSGKVITRSINPTPKELKRLLRKRGVLAKDRFVKIR
jgi:hypothetical protein